MRIDDDDDDDGLILFKEKHVIAHPLSLSQSSLHSSQSQEASPIKNSTSRMISRQERRKRRYEWRERQLLEQEQGGSTEAPTPESEDAFASLQSLLDPSQNMPQHIQSQGAEKENICRDTKMKDSDLDTDASDSGIRQNERETGKPNNRHVHAASSCPIQSVQRYHNREDTESIGFNMSRDGDDCDIDETLRPSPCIRESPEPPSSRFLSKGFGSHTKAHSSPARRTKKPRQGLSKLRKMIQVTSQNPLPFATERSHALQKPESDSSMLSNYGNGRTRTQLRAAEPKKAKSIVGSRPRHWNREKNRSMPFLQSHPRQELIQRRRFSSLPPSNAKVAQPSTTRTITARTTHPDTATLLKTKFFPRRDRNSHGVSTSDTRGNFPRNTSKPPVSFAPSFMSTTKRVHSADQVEETEPPTTSMPHSTTDHLFPSPPPRSRSRRGKKSLGVLGRKLEALQSARSNDTLRLQNQAFLRHKTLDINDPRKRANSKTDITIVGDCVWPYGTSADSTFTVLVYVHSHEHTERPEHAVLNDELAWATFTFGTARNINLQKGKQVRLYNSIFIPCQQFTTIHGLTMEKLKSNVCKHILLATWLCETLPGGLFELSFERDTEALNNGMEVDN